jgi:hypothetical protein
MGNVLPTFKKNKLKLKKNYVCQREEFSAKISLEFE